MCRNDIEEKKRIIIVILNQKIYAKVDKKQIVGLLGNKSNIYFSIDSLFICIELNANVP